MPIRFLAKPLGVAIICGNDGPGLLVVRRGIGKWALTADGRAWLALHRMSDLGTKRHQQRHHEAVLGAVRSGISKFQNIAVHLQLTLPEVRAALKALYKANLVEKIGVIGWRCPNAVQQPSKKKRAPVEHCDAESV